MDLLALYKNPEFGFQKATREALRAYIRRQPYLIYQPVANKDLSEMEFKYGYQFFLALDDNLDADIINWLKINIKPRMQNSFIKSVLRGAMIGPSVYACAVNDDERIYMNELMDKIKKDCPIAQEPPLRANKYIKKEKKKQKVKKDIIIKENTKSVSLNTQAHYDESNPFLNLSPNDSINLGNAADNNENSEDFDIFGDITSMLNNF